MLETVQKAALIAALTFVASVAVLIVMKSSQASNSPQAPLQQTEEASHSSAQKEPAEIRPPKTLSQTIASLWDKTTSEPVAFFTFMLALFTLALVIVSAIQIGFLIHADRIAAESAEASKKSAEVAERALLANNRPWVKLDIQVGGPIFFNVNGANLTLRYLLTNIGHSPATNVWVNPRVIVPFASVDGSGNRNPRVELQHDISELKGRTPSPLGYTLFPGDTIVQEITVSVSQEELQQATRLIKAIYPSVLGAVIYRIGFDDKPHLTSFLIEIRRSDTPRPATTEKNRSPAAIWVDEGDVPAVDVRLFRSVIDGGYAD